MTEQDTANVDHSEEQRRGADRPQGADRLKQSPGSVKVPVVVLNQRAWSATIPLPEIKPISGDRLDRKAARQTRREVAQIGAIATKIDVTIQAVQMVNTFVVHSVDAAQEDMMEILYSKTRHEGMNELVASVISQSLQVMVAQMQAISEHHFKRQMEIL